jgi:hypothetical protein
MGRQESLAETDTICLSETASFGRRNVSGVRGGGSLQDLIFVAVSIVFFVVSVMYVQFCDRIR